MPDGSFGMVSGHRIIGGSAWYWFGLVQSGYPLLAITEWDVRLRSDPFIVKAPQMWAEHHCVAPLEQWTIGNEAHAVALDDPDQALGRSYGVPTPITTDVEWYADSPVVELPPIDLPSTDPSAEQRGDAAARSRRGAIPAGFGPAGSGPAGFGPAGFDPAGFDPAGFGPAVGPAGSGPAGFDPAGFDPAGFDPAGFDPAGFDPAGFDPAGFDPAGSGPAGSGPAGSGPAGFGPAGFVQDGVAHGVVELLDRPYVELTEVPARRWRRWTPMGHTALEPLPLEPVMAHTGLRSPVAFPDGSTCDWVLTTDGWRERSVRSARDQRRLPSEPGRS
jgi:hypothetical protein